MRIDRFAMNNLVVVLVVMGNSLPPNLLPFSGKKRNPTACFCRTFNNVLTYTYNTNS